MMRLFGTLLVFVGMTALAGVVAVGAVSVAEIGGGSAKMGLMALVLDGVVGVGCGVLMGFGFWLRSWGQPRDPLG